MKAFFFSEKEAFLKCNGEFLGEINTNLKSSEICQNCLFEFLPINQIFAPTYSSIKGSNLVKAYPFYNGTFFYVNYEKKRGFPYKILSQNSFNLNGAKYNLTILLDGAIKFFIDGIFFVTDELPFIPNNSILKYLNGYIFAIFYGKKTAIYAYNLENGALCYKNLVENFELNTIFTTTTFYKNVATIQIEETFELSSNFTLVNRIAKKNKSAFEINKNLIPLFFFDLILNGANASEILCQNLNEKQGDIKAFIGDVKHTLLNPFNENEVVALYENKLSIYELEIKNGAIFNIIEKDWTQFCAQSFKFF